MKLSRYVVGNNYYYGSLSKRDKHFSKSNLIKLRSSPSHVEQLRCRNFLLNDFKTFLRRIPLIRIGNLFSRKILSLTDGCALSALADYFKY
jgi:hypothetical protein